MTRNHSSPVLSPQPAPSPAAACQAAPVPSPAPTSTPAPASTSTPAPAPASTSTSTTTSTSTSAPASASAPACQAAIRPSRPPAAPPDRARPAPACLATTPEDPDPHGALWNEVFGELQTLVEQTYALSHVAPLSTAHVLRAALRGSVLECATAVIVARRRPAPLAFEAPGPGLRALRDVRRVLHLARQSALIGARDHERLHQQSRRVSQALRQLQAEALLAPAA